MSNVQNVVNFQQGLGLVGDLYDTSPARVKTYNLVAGEGQSNAIGRVYTVDTTQDVTANLGGTGVIAGISINSREQALHGGLDSNLNLINPQAGGALCSFGRISVSVPEAVTIGMIASYNTTDGTLHALPEDTETAPAGQELLPNATFKFFNAAAGAISVLELG